MKVNCNSIRTKIVLGCFLPVLKCKPEKNGFENEYDECKKYIFLGY